MDTVRPGMSIRETLGSIAEGDPENFRIFFRRIRKMFPEEVSVACYLYIASKTADPAAQTMAFWLTTDGKNIRALLDVAALPAEEAFKAVGALKKFDPDFPIKFLKAVELVTAPAQILRALHVVPALGDYSVLLAWVRKLTQHSDEKVRSRAAKLLCELRPNRLQIERQMLSTDARVRAGAIEVLWNQRLDWAGEIFKIGARDAHHRVVGNALVGLYLQGDHSVFTRMIELCQSSDHLYRASMAWALGYVRELRGIPQLHLLAKDPHIMVRKRALRSLLALQTEESAVSEAQQPVEAKVEDVVPDLPELTPAPPPLVNKETPPTPKFATLR